MLALTLLCLTLMVLLTAFAIDLSGTYNSKQQLQAAIDSAALAGAGQLALGASTSQALRAAAVTEARVIANANFVTDDELAAGLNIDVGRWNIAAREFTVDAEPFNAIRVGARRNVGVFFAKFFGRDFLNVGGVAISAVSGLGQAQCLPPFAVLDTLVTGLEPGNTFSVSRSSPGNWGKIDLRDDISGEQDYREAIRDGVCDVTLSVGESIGTSTGFSGVDNGINDRRNLNPVILLPVVDNFPQGQSSPTQTVGFVEVEIISTSGSGNNWQGVFEIRETLSGFVGGGPSERPFSQTRVLVH